MNKFKEYKVDDQLKISDFKSKHLSAKYVSWLNDEEVVKYSEQRHKIHTIKSCKEYYLFQKKTDNLFLAIETGPNFNIHIGNIGVNIDLSNNIADVSIIIGDKDYWGKGIGLKVWNSIIRKLIDDMNIRLVTAGTMENNIPMINLMRKSNMKIEAILRKRFIHNAEEIGMVVASITK
jgi:[ribosomal protein S5]-alanine N-acetyltransferase